MLIVPIALRWLHLVSVIVLLGGIFYARVAVGDMVPRFKPVAYAAIGGILVSGLYHFLEQGARLGRLSDVVWNQNAVGLALVRGDDPVQRQKEIIDRSGDFRWADRGDRRVSAVDQPLTAARNATAGYEALRQAAAWLDVSGRGRLRVSGEDRARLLNAMTTNQVQTLRPGQGCYLFFLNAQGRILGDANLFCFRGSSAAGYGAGNAPEAAGAPGSLYHRRRRHH